MYDDFLIVTRHKGVIDWLRYTQNVTSQNIISHIYQPSQIYGRNAIGILPMRYALMTNIYGRVIHDQPPPWLQKHDYSWEELVNLNARIIWHYIKKLNPDEIEHYKEFAKL